MKTRMDSLWQLATCRDIDKIKRFLTPRETWATGCSDRVRKTLANGRMTPRLLNMTMILPDSEAGSLNALVFFGHNGLVFPVFGTQAATEAINLAALENYVQRRSLWTLRKPFSCIGKAGHVQSLETAFTWQSRLSISYLAMAQVEASTGKSNLMPAGLTVRQAGLRDLEKLLPLACAYDREEVLTELHQFNPDVSRAAQLHSLRHLCVFLAEFEGRVIGRAQTNAIGFSREQIGGVYVLPEFRNKGIAGHLMNAILSQLNRRSRLASLFVKKSNPPAIRLYEHCGFVKVADYNVDYF
jgi:predicted GNAT family acetyltransferase